MIIYYDTLTGNTSRFTRRLMKLDSSIDLRSVDDLSKASSSERAHLLSYTTGIGEVPKSTLRFYASYPGTILSVASTGNRNWGLLFGATADKLSEWLSVPKFKIELSGDTQVAKEYLEFIGGLE